MGFIQNLNQVNQNQLYNESYHYNKLYLTIMLNSTGFIYYMFRVIYNLATV
jgi:hypothetical protein